MTKMNTPTRYEDLHVTKLNAHINKLQDLALTKGNETTYSSMLKQMDGRFQESSQANFHRMGPFDELMQRPNSMKIVLNHIQKRFKIAT